MGYNLKQHQAVKKMPVTHIEDRDKYVSTEHEKWLYPQVHALENAHADTQMRVRRAQKMRAKRKRRQMCATNMR